MPRRLRQRPFWAALAALALLFLAAGCSQTPGSSSAPTTRTTATRATTTTTTGPSGTWSKAIRVAANANLSVVTCAVPSSCIMGTASGQTYRLFLDKISALGPAVPSPSPQGVAYLSCGVSNFCAAAPNLNQVAFLDGSSWDPPATISAAQGITAIDCTGPTFCITIDGEGNSFA